MLNPLEIENLYTQYTENLSQLAHDGVIHVDLHLLHALGLLEDFQDEKEDTDDLTQYFHVMESAEKVTLFNEQFLTWIVPKMEGDNPITYVIIALNSHNQTHLEVVFTTSGVYNTPKYVLRVLQHFLLDMLETEATLTAMEKDS